jgi:RimJ/RimL family protein N-acetyltransferase
MQLLTGQWGTRSSQPNPAGIIVRPLQPDDVGLIHAMHGRLSPESLYYRYLRQRPPTLDEIAALYRLDPGTGAGFVAMALQEDQTIVGVAYYVREAQTQSQTAETAILVEDQFQGQGIGRCLWQQLQQHAQAHQIHQLRVFLDPGNGRMQRLVHGSGLPYTAKVQGGLKEYLVTLDQRPRPASAGLIRDWAVAYWEALHPYSAGGAYANFMMEEGQERVQTTY